MQQDELCEILPELKKKRQNYKLYGIVSPTAKDIHIAKVRAENLKLLAQQKANKEKWQRIQEARCFNLVQLAKEKAEREQQQDIRLLEIVKENPQILSSVR